MARPGRKKKNIGPCSAEGCARDSVTRGYCTAHYQRLKRKGELELSGSDGNLNPVSFAPGIAAALSLSTEAARVDALLALKQ